MSAFNFQESLMLKSTLRTSPLVFTLAMAFLSPAAAVDIEISMTNEQLSGSSYTADVLVQHASGITELVPVMLTATGQYDFSIATPGSMYTPPGEATFRLWGPGAGSGNSLPGPGGDGPGPGQLIQCIGGGLSGNTASGAQTQGWQLPGIIIIGSAACIAQRMIAASIAEGHCRNSGGVQSAEYSWCGVAHSVTCRERPFQPTPLPPPGNGGSGGYNGAPPQFFFLGFRTDTAHGIVEVGDVKNAE